MVKNMYYYIPKNNTEKYECVVINDNIKQKRCAEVNDGILEYEIKMIKIKYNKGENTYELDVLPEEIEYNSKI
tara:strand:+ start:90 stop:308 length:219 start_codon:yes stop_codon:yes gene_type:complete